MHKPALKMILFVFLLLLPAKIFSQSAVKADALYDRASSLYELGRYEEAIELFEQCAEIDSRLGKDRRSARQAYAALGVARMLHFATHGLVVPPVPELSALVLSQLPGQPVGEEVEDGYLTMAEITNLCVAADFVNLSACETGLGRIYGGEGVVGLCQSFLVAGANGLSVSLWQVADESTKEFMVGLYRLLQDKNMSYDRAMTEMKRIFIQDSAFDQSFYWAPFVYYGK